MEKEKDSLMGGIYIVEKMRGCNSEEAIDFTKKFVFL